MTAVKDKTIGGYEMYLRKYPNGPHALDATKALEQARREQAWQDAKKKDTIASYGEFLTMFPQGSHTTEADAALKDVRWKATVALTAFGKVKYSRTDVDSLVDGLWGIVVQVRATSDREEVELTTENTFGTDTTGKHVPWWMVQPIDVQNAEFWIEGHRIRQIPQLYGGSLAFERECNKHEIPWAAGFISGIGSVRSPDGKWFPLPAMLHVRTDNGKHRCPLLLKFPPGKTYQFGVLFQGDAAKISTLSLAGHTLNITEAPGSATR